MTTSASSTVNAGLYGREVVRASYTSRENQTPALLGPALETPKTILVTAEAEQITDVIGPPLPFPAIQRRRSPRQTNASPEEFKQVIECMRSHEK